MSRGAASNCTDDDLRAAILALHEDGQHRTVELIRQTLRRSGLVLNGYRVDVAVRELRSARLIPGRINSTAAFRRAAAPQSEGEPEPWWRAEVRGHLARERRIRRWARTEVCHRVDV